MNINVEVKREEAIKRLEILKSKGLKYLPAIKCFKDGKDIGLFENQGFMKSVYYQVKLNTGDKGFYDKLYSKIQDFEKLYNSLVYLVLVSHSSFGTLCDFFYVSDHKTEWGDDRNDLLDGYTYAYSYNMDDDLCSEIGEIAFKADPMCGGIYRYQ